MTTLADLRSRGLGPQLYSHCVRDGVLRDVGLAAQEVPSVIQGGSYSGYLHTLNAADHDASLIPALRTSPAHVTGAVLTAIQQALLVDGELPLGDLATDYARGNFLCLQNVGFAPRMVGLAPTQYDYTAGLTTTIAAWSGRPIMVNCGASTHDGFPSGELRFNIAFPIRCRPADNLLRPFLEYSAYQIDPTAFIHNPSIPCADGVAREWVRNVLDFTHPTVVSMILEHVESLVTTFGTQIRYLCHGESGHLYHRFGTSQVDCAEGIDVTNCVGCEPATNVAPHVVAGFREWLQEALALDIVDLNNRWVSTFGDFDSIDPSTQSFCPSPGSQAILDFTAFQSFLASEVGWQTYREVKLRDSTAIGTRLTFGSLGMERSSMEGDFGAVGDYQGETSDVYRVDRELIFRPLMAAARLHGVPGHFPLTASTYSPPAPGTTWPPDLPVILRASIRTYTVNEVRWLFRDLLAAGSVGFGYLRAPTAAINWHAPSKSAVLDTLEEMVDLHPHAFAVCGPHQRLAVHVDPEDATNMRRPLASAGAGRVGYWLHQQYRDAHAGVALFHDARVLKRHHARASLLRSIVVAPYHTGLADVLDDYRDSFLDGSSGGVIVVEENATATVPAWVDDVVVLATNMGALYRGTDTLGAPANVWYFAARPAQPCRAGDKHWRRIATVLREQVIPFVGTELADLGGVPWAATPLVIESTSTDIQTNYVTDGLNFTVGISNLSTTATIETDVGILPAIATALDVSYATQTVTLTPGETEILRFDATPETFIDVQAAIDDAQAKVALLGAYQTADVTALLTHAETLVGTYPSRALAGYLAATRIPLLDLDAAAGTLTVSAVRLGLVGEATSIPISGGLGQVVWPLNGREEGAEGVTDGAGAASVAIGAPVVRRWDFAASAFADPLAGDGDLAEVHVTDPATGASTRQMLAV